MVGQTVEQVQSGQEAGTFEPIPSRIQEVPELIIEPGTEQVRIEITETLMDLGGRLGSVHMTVAEAFLSQGQYAEAVPHIEAAVVMDPENIANQNQLGYVRYLAGDDAGALAAFDCVLAAQPANPDALYNVGMIAFGSGDLARSETCFRACAQVDSDNPEVWNNLGVVLHQQGNVAGAQTCFQQTLAIEPDNADAKFNLGNLDA